MYIVFDIASAHDIKLFVTTSGLEYRGTEAHAAQ